MNFWQKTKRFLEPILGSKKEFLYQMIAHAIIHLAGIFPVLLFLLVNPQQLTSEAGKIIFIGLIIYSLIAYPISWFLRSYYWVHPAYSYEKTLFQKYLKHIIQGNNLEYEKYGTGRILTIFEKGTHQWTIGLLELPSFVLEISIVGIVAIWRLHTTGDIFLLVFLGLFGLVVIVAYFGNKVTMRLRRIRKEKETEQTNAEVRVIMSKFETLQNNKVDSEIQNILSFQAESRNLASEQMSSQNIMYDIPRFTFLLSIFALYVLSTYGLFTLPGGTTQMISLITVLILIQGLMIPLLGFFKNFTKDFAHIEKLWDLYDTLPVISGYDVGKKFLFKQGNYEFKKLSFSYYENGEVLKNFSLKIQGGKKTALVGHSGGGKTTLMKLLAGYMSPNGGSLSIDGQDITSIRLDSYYPHIGYLTQEPSVFDGTIEENLLYGARKKTTKKEIEKAIEMAECQFIYELEDGIKTEIGERGIRLSGGQKQRLAIAKIFLKNPEIILLDEPTAALDSYSEQKVAQAFHKLFEGRTVIVIAHRLQTVKEADDIIVLEKGRVVERGTHKELLKLGKKYAGMVDLQSGVVREDEE